ncbi:hypothetical protein ACFV7Q_32860 [Streptomyces sp. NPDC059851]|uniref:hypothetical protein n=1 Tax=Streptomyces sp. NPDC059851 TaxID=3346971 RepID=UPI003650146E
MHSGVVFALGVVGALAPEIVRLYGIREDPARFTWSWFYVVVSVAFAALGGVLALLMPATSYWGALYIGVSTPVLVNTLVRKGRQEVQPDLRSGPVAPTPHGGAPMRYGPVDSYLNSL